LEFLGINGSRFEVDAAPVTAACTKSPAETSIEAVTEGATEVATKATKVVPKAVTEAETKSSTESWIGSCPVKRRKITAGSECLSSSAAASTQAAPTQREKEHVTPPTAARDGTWGGCGCLEKGGEI
jgi:hypothetical protein